MKKTKSTAKGCRNQRVGSTTVLQCTTCAANFKPNSELSACNCAPGYKREGGSCVACGAGNWCAGGDDETAHPCGVGLTTLVATAAREDQCVTVAGYGFNGTAASRCSVGAYSTGKARNPCRSCGGGLTTAAVGSTAFADCVAPPGYYFDKNAAKACPKGTYATARNKDPSCKPCSAGVTTAATSSTDPDDCALAKPGWRLTSATTAAKCALHSFQPLTDAVADCTACPPNMVTLKVGAATRTACVAKPGYEYVDDTAGATACAVGSYRAGSNRRPCIACGDGFNTTGAGKISFADCYIPRGWGTNKDAGGGGYAAAQCEEGFYGAAKNTFGVKSLPCTPCPAGMTAPSGSNGPEDCITVAGWGYDQVTGTAQKCEAGSWSAGGGRDECESCGEGYTTPTDGSSAASACEIAPGYGYKTGGDPEPCAKGFFGTGGVDKSCTACSGQTMTTLDSLATSQADCDVCVAGFGGVGCAACAPNTYNQGDAAACAACANGAQSPAGATTADACLPPWTALPPSADSIAIDVADTSYVSLVTLTASSDPAAACKAACDAAAATCMFYTFDSTNAKCYLASKTSGSDSIAFKSATGTYTIWAWTASASVGTDFGAATTGTTQAACLSRCDASDECVAAVFSASNTCTLKAASTSPDFKACEYRAVGALMPAVSVASA
jgi:hypothetical protein